METAPSGGRLHDRSDTMADVTKQQVLETLAKVRGPDMEGDLVSLGMVSDVFISDDKVYFSITVPAERARELEPLRAAAEHSVTAIPGVRGALVTLTARSEEHTSELQSLMRNSYAAFCLKKKNIT